MDKLIISGAGFPGTTEYLLFAEKSSHDLIEALTKGVGNEVIISGVVDTAGTVSDGWIIHANEIFPFEGGALGATVIITEEVSSAGYDTTGTGDFTNILPIWKVRKAKFGGPGDANVVDSFAFNTLKRIQTNQELTTKMLQFLMYGTITILRPDVNNQSISHDGDITASAITSATGQLTHYELQITFPEILTDYEPIVNVIKATGTEDIAYSIAIVEKTTTTLKVKLNPALAFSDSNGKIKLGFRLIGAN